MNLPLNELRRQQLEETLRVNFLKKQELITLLLACPNMADRASRDNLLSGVRKGKLRANFNRNDVALIDVENIVNKLLDFSGALEELISFIRLKDSGTNALQALETFLNSLQIRTLRVYLASPGDVNAECQVVREALERLSNSGTFRGSVAFRLEQWEEAKANASPATTTHEPPKLSAYDLVIALFWGQLGEPRAGKGNLSGTHFALQEALNSPHPETLIYRRTEEKLFRPSDKAGIAQWEQMEKFFQSTLFGEATGNPSREVCQYNNPTDFREQFEPTLEKVVQKLLARPLPSSAPTSSNNASGQTISHERWEGSPFPGLRSFAKKDAPIFFGREAETDALVKRVSESRFVAVVGASGSGKSSLVGAGLLPRLEANVISGSQDWYVVQFKPGEADSPFAALYEALVKTFKNLQPPHLERRKRKQEFVTNMRSDPATLCEALAPTLEELSAPEWAEILLFIDQFEELFTQAPKEDFEPFVKMLHLLVDQPRLRVVITIRHDFVHRAIANPTLAELLNQGFFSLAAPTTRVLARMIKGPAEYADLKFEEGLPEEILQDAGSEAGSLALMAYTLDELYNLAVKGATKQLNFADYTKLGRVEGAIGQRAEATFNVLKGEEEAKKELLGQVFRELVNVSNEGTIATATRKRAALESFVGAEQALVDAFTKARLLVSDSDSKIGYVEVAHESLFQSWKWLQQWIGEAQEDLILRRQVQNAAAEWQRKGRPEYLHWNHERLTLVKAMCERLTPQWSKIEQDFLEPEEARLIRELHQLTTSHPRRREIGDRLSQSEDTRPGVGLREDGLPDIAWLPVAPGGEVEIEGATFRVAPFYIARYPITNCQYDAFVKAEDGFNNLEWWADMPKEYQRQALDSPYIKAWNNPRDTISWYQSVAFTRWLNYRLSGLELPLPGNPSGPSFVVGSNVELRLPTEWEWQWAAQGGSEQRKYPWGEWQEGYANTSEAGQGRPLAVGMYPQGRASCGADDMGGNVWEWCLNEYSNSKALINFNSTNSRVLRLVRLHCPHCRLR
ncbi:MAG: SUMF1/EgtB/PvdO family nonheme iron enzyme [Chloroflexi bacterium]|nr:SUMF1/EgtB/PvdO family nonheme iron enzyme [Chloroflexota bacterium]